jgi:hypothetical protein
MPSGMMAGWSAPLLIAAAVADAGAALIHLACIAVGAPMYRMLGAGPRMVALAEAGHWYPPVVTLLIAAVLAAFAVYALAGAGLVPPPPLLRTGLAAIGALLVLRGFAFIPAFLAGRGGAATLHVLGSGGSIAFWYWSSAICLVLGLLHLGGLAGAWSRL